MRYLALLLAFVAVHLAGRAQSAASFEQPHAARMERLGVLGSVLMIGAHDDDDNTHLLTYFSLGLNLRTGYLSLARGTGAQNRIGTEQNDAMGVLLTQEAIAARRISGVEQYYTRVFDFGFSKTLRESLERWDRPEVVSDIVWVLRRFRPDVVIIRYAGTPRDGHGNHQASAVLAQKALVAAADPAQFAGQLKHVSTWTPKRVVQYGGGGPSAIMFQFGGKSPHIAKAYSEIASLSRRSFLSQAMGGTVYPLTSRVLFTPIDGNTDPQLFGGIDISWRRLNGGGEIENALVDLKENHSEKRPDALLDALLTLRARLATIESDFDPWIALKRRELDETIARCAGLSVRATSAAELVTPGSSVEITTSVGAGMDGVVLTRVTLQSRTDETQLLAAPVALSDERSISFGGVWRVPDHAAPSQPYWLGARDDVVAVVDDPMVIGLADDPPVLRVRFEFRTGNRAFELTRAVYAQIKAPGEESRAVPLVIAPDVTLHPLHNTVIFPNGASRELSVRVLAHCDHAVGRLTLDMPPNWNCEPREHRFGFNSVGDFADFRFTITPASGAVDARIFPQARINGRRLSFDRVVVDYPHIEPKIFFPVAQVRAVNLSVNVSAKTIGYIVGTGDQIPQCLQQLGCVVTELSPDDLAQRDLTGFDAIVLGIRAYNVRPDVQTHQSRLRDYVKQGGTLIMQYTVSPRGPNAIVDVPHLGPYPFQLGVARVTVEDAPVDCALPDHVVLSRPNAIGAADFSGWVQERGLHFADKWHPNYEAPLECHDPGEAPQHGGLLFARHGDGVFIYTAHS